MSPFLFTAHALYDVGMTNSDDAGEVAQLRAELAESEREHEKSLAVMEAALDQRDEALAEVKRLRVGPLEVDRLVKALQEFDPSDDYHRGDTHTPGYYAAIDRAIKLVRGEIHGWTDRRADTAGADGAPADDAGELPTRTRAVIRQRDEARAEADHLRAEVERLRDAATVMEGAWSVCDDERNDAVARLAAIDEIVDEWDDGHEGVSRRFCPSCVRVDRLRTTFAAKPVSLTDVGEECE